MATSQMPFDSSFPDYTMGFTIPETGVSYIGRLKWNARAGLWFFDLQDDTGDPIITGIACVLGVLLGDRCNDPRFPPGAFFMSDLSGADKEAGVDDLGARVPMFWAPATDLDA